ncbi:hypothetical protein SAMN06265337_3259 [Hymenobacter gelipurpurascens]|uniref:Uncharacterized protein n=1 Tax=Hymenobacter gelipurpurascens TaxID=89968 RepID=A0A212UD69_9BACT|nr:hypothetical protein [Hymenobacter gelipurpurascens]SNC76189.1 hypothetical protein SAMN06265337_3259 [Hymenobacter gelipurpurascens]
MKKTKNKKKSGKKSLFGGAAKSLKKLGKGSGLGRLSTTQKVLGGAALVAVGLSYFGKRRISTPATPPTSDATAAEQSLASMEGADL